ncbi:MAG TPA: hypothetical protein VN903_32440 [Polyangia bacterium]|nr:hypothetical protein [Polyangia bacterium]
MSGSAFGMFGGASCSSDGGHNSATGTAGTGMGMAGSMGGGMAGSSAGGTDVTGMAGSMGTGGTMMRQAAVEITIGAMMPRTGVNANDDWITAVNLAVTQMNAAMLASNSTRPIKFKLSMMDTASNQAMGLASMATFAAAGAPVVISEASGAATGGNMYNYTTGNTPIPVIAFSATSGDLNNATKTDTDPVKQAALQDAGNWFFRTCQVSSNLSNIRYGLIFSKGAGMNGDINGDGTVKITWVGTNDSSTASSINGDITSFTAKAPSTAPFIPETVTFDPGTDPTTFSYTNVILQITDNMTGTMTDATTDLIYNKALTNVAIPFIKAYKTSGRKIPMFQDGSFRRNTILVALGTSADGQEGVSPVAYENTASGLAFAAAEQAMTAFPPAAYEAQAYDSTILAMAAVAKAWFADPTLTAAPTPDLVRTAMTQLNDTAGTKFGSGVTSLTTGVNLLAAGSPVNYDGASGPVDLDALGNVTGRAAWWVIENGLFVEKKVYDCIAASTCPETTF